MSGKDTLATTGADLAGQGRLVAAVIAGAAMLWVAGTWLVARQGWDPSYLLLLDLAAIAAFIWALIVTFGLWRRQRAGSKGGN
jgi:type VI protein secretion system component VasK